MYFYSVERYVKKSLWLTMIPQIHTMIDISLEPVSVDLRVSGISAI